MSGVECPGKERKKYMGRESEARSVQERKETAAKEGNCRKRSNLRHR